jgi:hypothetical protein
MAAIKQRLGALAQRFKLNVSVISLPLLVACGVLVGVGYRVSWTGFASKTFWDWLDLFIIPAVLGAGAFLFNRAERRSEQQIATQRTQTDRAIADERSQESALQAYLDRMTELLLREGLRSSYEYSELRTVARARTLTVLRGLDGTRRGALLRFLSESLLVEATALQRAPIISLSGADLSGAFLWGVYLSGADLRGAILVAADLTRADLTRADLTGADLRGADLRGATGTTNEQLAQAASLIGATLPDGTKIETEEQWQAFKAKYGN